MRTATLLLVTLILSTVGAGAVPPAAHAERTQRILAVGDSITEDNPANFPNASGAWRAPLHALLQGAGRYVEFVGSHTLDVPVQPGLSGHDAYGGWATCDFFTDGRASVREPLHAASWDITQAITDAAPDVVVVDIGTNNYINQQYFERGTVPTLECPPTRKNLTRLFDAIVNHPSHPRVVISTIEDASNIDATTPVNLLISSYVAERQAAGQQVCLAVEPASMAGLTLPGDPFHLNPSGKAAVAAALYGPTLAALDHQCAATSATTPQKTPPLGSLRLYPDAAVPPQSVDGGPPVVTGQRVTFSCGGAASGIWWYRLAGDTGQVTVEAWKDGLRAANGSATYPAGVGWTYLPFAAPIAVLGGDELLFALFHPNGAYPYTTNGFTARTVVAPSRCLRAPASTPSRANGLFVNASRPELPTQSYRDNEYWLGPDLQRPCFRLRCLTTDLLWSMAIIRQQLTIALKTP